MLIIDGHNLAFADDHARRLLIKGDPERARMRIIELAVDYADDRKDPVLVVFDGTGGNNPREQSFGRVRCRYSGADRDADLEIAQVLSSSRSRHGTCVVTSDRHLRTVARTFNADTIGSKKFLQTVARIRRKQQERPKPEPMGKLTGAPPTEVDYWLNVFKEEDVAAAEEEFKPRGD